VTGGRHLRTADNAFTGHVDALEPGGRMQLELPRTLSVRRRVQAVIASSRPARPVDAATTRGRVRRAPRRLQMYLD